MPRIDALVLVQQLLNLILLLQNLHSLNAQKYTASENSVVAAVTVILLPNAHLFKNNSCCKERELVIVTMFTWILTEIGQYFLINLHNDTLCDEMFCIGDSTVLDAEAYIWTCFCYCKTLMGMCNLHKKACCNIYTPEIYLIIKHP